MNDCLFCKIIDGEISTDFLHDDQDLVAFKDINPQAPVHLLIVPKRHIPSVNRLEEADAPLVGKMVLAAKELAQKLGIAQSGYRLIVNVERGGGQEIFHIHMHLLGGWK